MKVARLNCQLSTMSVAPTLGVYKLPTIDNEPMRNYEPNSKDRQELQKAVDELLACNPFEIPVIIDGQEFRSGKLAKQVNPGDHARAVCYYHEADERMVSTVSYTHLTLPTIYSV